MDGDAVYNIMFGPDICGGDKKTHVIFNYKGKNHLIKKTINPESDQLTREFLFALLKLKRARCKKKTRKTDEKDRLLISS